ncbi:MAG: hypothetical protein K2N01_12335 [Lachnospiraceae bacterium]|nr:hypothetical protein [Lachnospiraceae bacterium]
MRKAKRQAANICPCLFVAQKMPEKVQCVLKDFPNSPYLITLSIEKSDRD